MNRSSIKPGRGTMKTSKNSGKTASEKARLPNIHANPDQISITKPKIANCNANSWEIEEDNPRDNRTSAIASRKKLMAAPRVPPVLPNTKRRLR